MAKQQRFMGKTHFDQLVANLDFIPSEVNFKMELDKNTNNMQAMAYLNWFKNKKTLNTIMLELGSQPPLLHLLKINVSEEEQAQLSASGILNKSKMITFVVNQSVSIPMLAP